MNENPSSPVNLTEEQLNILAGKVLVTFFGNPDIYRPKTLEERAFRIFLENVYFLKIESFDREDTSQLQLIAERSFSAARMFEQIAQEQRTLAKY